MGRAIPPIRVKWYVKSPKQRLRAWERQTYPAFKRWIALVADSGVKSMEDNIPPPHNAGSWDSDYDWATGRMKSTVSRDRIKTSPLNKHVFTTELGIKETRRNKKFIKSHVYGKTITPKRGKFLWFRPERGKNQFVRARSVTIQPKPFMEDAVKAIDKAINTVEIK